MFHDRVQGQVLPFPGKGHQLLHLMETNPWHLSFPRACQPREVSSMKWYTKFRQQLLLACNKWASEGRRFAPRLVLAQLRREKWRSQLDRRQSLGAGPP